MHALTLRRSGFAATLLTGFVLIGAGIGGLSAMDTTLELAAAPAPDRPALVSYEPVRGPGGDCDERRDDRRHRV